MPTEPAEADEPAGDEEAPRRRRRRGGRGRRKKTGDEAGESPEPVAGEAAGSETAGEDHTPSTVDAAAGDNAAEQTAEATEEETRHPAVGGVAGAAKARANPVNLRRTTHRTR